MRLQPVSASRLPLGLVFLWLGVGALFLGIGFFLEFWIFVLVGGVAFIIGWLSLALYLFTYISGRRVGVPILLIEERPFRVGERFSVQVDLLPARRVDVNGFALELIFRERAVYDRGTDTMTVTKDYVVDERRWMARRLHPSELFEEEVLLQIPADAMHSFAVRRNELSWFVRFTVDVPRLPDVSVREALTILPELVEVPHDE